MVTNILFFSFLTMSIFNYDSYASNEKFSGLNFQISDEISYFFEDDNFVVIGNDFNIDNNNLNEIKDNINEKNLVIYFINKNNNNQILDFNDTNAIIYFKNKEGKIEKTSLEVDSNDENKIKKEILDFIFDFSLYIQSTIYDTHNKVELDMVYSTNNTYGHFETIYYSSYPDRRIVNPEYGYIVISYTVSKYRANITSSLWLIQTKVSFVPGGVARSNGDSTFKDYKNKAGYLHLEAIQPVEEISQEYKFKGGIPYLKDAFPVNQPGIVSINSSFNIGLTLGYSFTDGFSTSGQTSSIGGSYGANIGFGYSKSYQNSEPLLSAQQAPYDFNTFQWNYTYDSKRDGQKLTNHLNTGYIFEQNNSGHYLGENDIAFKYDLELEMRRTTLVFYDTKFVRGTVNIAYHP